MNKHRGPFDNDNANVLHACLVHFLHMDLANAAIHMNSVRYSPITFAVAEQLVPYARDRRGAGPRWQVRTGHGTMTDRLIPDGELLRASARSEYFRDPDLTDEAAIEAMRQSSDVILSVVLGQRRNLLSLGFSSEHKFCRNLDRIAREMAANVEACRNLEHTLRSEPIPTDKE